MHWMTYQFLVLTFKNSCLQALSSKKNYIICGPEFDLENEGRIVIVFWALYGGNSADDENWPRVWDTMADMNFAYCKVDPD